ncbi:3-hydroxyacyl-ACP dehydratase FabZ family protein [Kitasatospora purpeofusca]|uniref:3-hydroxyacyl-ACP dehydratase FabZ family protein n=1 Tax=Kitasatospora purpeofusca TaxID=67352 RepID=UPI0035E04CB1
MISPVLAPVEVVRPPAVDGKGRFRALAEVTVGADETVLPGHYPGFPIFPGVCVIECVRLGALQAPPPEAGPLALVSVDTARFLSPVFPGDRLRLELTWSGGPGAWTCGGEVATHRAVAARVRLRFDGGGEA